MKSFFWAFPPHPNMGETFSSNSEPSRHLPFNTKTSVVEMTDRSARVYENSEANWGRVSREGGCCAAKKLHTDHGFAELANWECKRRAYLINQLWLSHLPERITACGFAVREVLWLLTVYSCYLESWCCWAAWTTMNMPVWCLVLCPDCRRCGKCFKMSLTSYLSLVSNMLSLSFPFSPLPLLTRVKVLVVLLDYIGGSQT